MAFGARPTLILASLALLPAQSDSFEGTRPGDERQIAGIRFSWAPAGTFRMGSPLTEPERRADEGPVTVTLSQGFWIGKFEVTQAQWLARMSAFPRNQDKGRGGDVPVYWVSYLDATEFCRRLTTHARASGDLPAGWEIQLPTEAQWEYAARAGTTEATHFGQRLTPSQANIGSPYPGGTASNRDGQSVKAGSYPANAWGLHDMHGNVWEWCRDWYHSQLPGGRDPDLSTTRGQPNRDGSYSRVRRGGAWIEQGWANRSAVRLQYEPERNSDHIGFRVIAAKR